MSRRKLKLILICAVLAPIALYLFAIAIVSNSLKTVLLAGSTSVALMWAVNKLAHLAEKA